jgi:hypothetical protein
MVIIPEWEILQHSFWKNKELSRITRHAE